MAGVIEAGPVVTIAPDLMVDVDAAVVTETGIDGWHGEELYPCSFCGSTGACEHLMRVIHVPGKNGAKRPIPMRAEMGPEWGRRRMVRLVGELAQVYLQSGEEK